MLDVCFSVKPLSKKLLEIQKDTNLFGTRKNYQDKWGYADINGN
jgi:hypothetical protein